MRRHIRPAALIAVILGSAAAHGESISVLPGNPAVQPGVAQAFTAHVRGISDPGVTWLVNGVRFGAPAIGTISPGGLYLVPDDAAAPFQVAIEAASQEDALVSGGTTASVAQSSITGPSFYVATTGNDGNSGSSGSPWATLQHAVDTVPAGATIHVETGIYNELVSITHSGSAAGGYISLIADAGQTPVIDGTGLPIPGGQAGLITISNASYIRVSGFELRNYSSSSPKGVPIGIYVVGAGSRIEILNNHVHDIVTTVTSSSGDALGIAIYGSKAPQPIEHLIIDGNELDNLVTGFSESLAITGNVEYWQVTNNLIHDNDNIGIDIAGYERVAPDPAYDRARRGLIAGNTVYNISSVANPAYQGDISADGIYVDGGTQVTIQQNLVYKSDLGIELASEHFGRETSQVIARDNVVYQSNIVGISIGGYGPARGGTADCVIVNNTLFDDDTMLSGTGELQIQYYAHNNVFKNNILYANAQGLLVYSFVADGIAPAAMNANLYFTTAGTPRFTWLNRTYKSLAAYQRGAGVDRMSRFADPLFVATTGTPDLQLSIGSPAIGAGLDLGLVDLGLVDFAGSPRTNGMLVDIGAYQN